MELSCGKDATRGAGEEQLAADLIDFQVTQGLMDFIHIQSQGGPHFWFQEEGNVILEHVRQRMHLSGNTSDRRYEINQSIFREDSVK